MALLEAVKNGNLEDVKASIDSDSWFENTPWSDYILLNEAIQCNHLKIVEFLLGRNCRVNCKDLRVPERTPLHWAIAKRNDKLVKKLLDKSASLDARDADDDTPVHLAGKSKKIKIVNKLVRYISSPLNLVNSQGLTHLHVACMSDNLDSVVLFLQRSADVQCAVKMNSPLKPGFTPLHFAVFYGRNKIAKVLLNAGANPDAADADGATPLHLAFRKKNDCLVKFILTKYSLDTTRAALENLVDNKKISYFHIACSQNDCAVLDKFSMEGIDINGGISSKSYHLPGYTPLHVAVLHNCNNTITWLLKKGADITKREKGGFTPVHQAFWRKEYELLDLFTHEMAKVSTYENPVNVHGVSFFHISCVRDNPDVIKEFINRGLDINLPIEKSSKWLATCTPLHLAVRFENPGNVEVLLQNKANVYAADDKGATPLHYVCQWHDEMIKVLTQIVQKIVWDNTSMDTLGDHLAKSIKILKLFADLNIDVNIVDNSKLTPLFYLFSYNRENAVSNALFMSLPYRAIEFYWHVFKIIMKHRVEMFKTMLKLKPNFELTDNYNSTFLHILAARNFHCFIENQEEVAQLTIENGGNVNAVNHLNETPLFMAACNGNEKLVDILLKMKADVNIFVETHSLGTPLAAAVEYLINSMQWSLNEYYIARKLIKHGADVNVMLVNGRTVLHHIFGSGNFVDCRDCLSLRFVDCDLDIQERGTGRTPLHLATLVGDATAVDWLLRGNANFDAVDFNGFSPVMYCARQPRQTGEAYYLHFQRLYLIGYKFTPSLKRLAALVETASDKNCFLNEQRSLEELGRLKDYVINQYCTMYAFLFRSIQEMAYYMNNKKVRALLSDSKLCENFPRYGPMIASKCRKALQRNRILKQSVYSFGRITSFALPEIIADIVLGFLEHADVMKIIEVAIPKI